jgi:hypothetical protein
MDLVFSRYRLKLIPCNVLKRNLVPYDARVLCGRRRGACLDLACTTPSFENGSAFLKKMGQNFLMMHWMLVLWFSNITFTFHLAQHIYELMVRSKLHIDMTWIYLDIWVNGLFWIALWDVLNSHLCVLCLADFSFGFITSTHGTHEWFITHAFSFLCLIFLGPGAECPESSISRS